MQVTSWNIAAINNNPWEYWITYDNDEYNKLMKGIEDFIENPGDKDICISNIFSNDMALCLFDKMKNITNWNGIDKVKDIWINDYSKRKIISEFLKDKTIGAKRLASMPDRFTNTIKLAEPKDKILCRPTIINCFEGDLSSINLWFDTWINFIFNEKTNSKSKDGNSIITKNIYELFPKILKSKYPAITEEEEEISIPLQVLCLGIFDCILVHMMNSISNGKEWMNIKLELCNKLNNQKIERTCEIINRNYINSSIIALQECGAIFLDQLGNYKNIAKEFISFAPNKMDTSRDQNSVILLRKNDFNFSSVNELTSLVLDELNKNSEKKAPIVNGDLFVISVESQCKNNKYFIASFHGDTNGLATIPILQALYNLYKNNYNDHLFIFALDANTYENPSSSQQGINDFANFYSSQCNLTSCFGRSPNPSNYTTFNARTYLQPQLNKACKSSDKKKGGDINPKDFILFREDQFEITKWTKDNTGNIEYIEDIVFPTLTFPSDHGILSAFLKQISSSSL